MLADFYKALAACWTDYRAEAHLRHLDRRLRIDAGLPVEQLERLDRDRLAVEPLIEPRRRP